ncbi:MAG TPA: hypothetical protein VGO86_16765 [Candidatus Dormibacteraeota bacterium]
MRPLDTEPAVVALSAERVRDRRAGQAAERFREGLRILRSLGARYNVAECLEGFAWLAAQAGHPERALRLAAAAASSRGAVGTPRPPSSSPLVEDWIAGARAALPNAPEVWEAGLRLSEEAAIAMALDEPDQV